MIVAGAFVFFFNDTATTEIYTLSLHDALPISAQRVARANSHLPARCPKKKSGAERYFQCLAFWRRSEEHTSELQSQSNLVCRLLLEKKKKGLHTRPLQSSTMNTPVLILPAQLA